MVSQVLNGQRAWSATGRGARLAERFAGGSAPRKRNRQATVRKPATRWPRVARRRCSSGSRRRPTRLELFDPQTADLDMPLPPLGRVGGGARGELEWLRRAEWVSHRTRVRWSGSDDALKKTWTQQLQRLQVNLFGGVVRSSSTRPSRRPCGGGPSSSRRAFGAAIRRRRCCAAAGGVPTTTQSGWCATARRKWRTRMGARWSFS